MIVLEKCDRHVFVVERRPRPIPLAAPDRQKQAENNRIHDWTTPGAVGVGLAPGEGKEIMPMTERGLVPRLAGTERLILDLLREGELFGLQLVDRSEGALKRGTVYVTLGRMQDKGYVESRTEPLPVGAIGLPRRWYRPTAYGLRVRDAWLLAARAFAEQDLQAGAA
jgi:PadR family transcriptional regulator PadR